MPTFSAPLTSNFSTLCTWDRVWFAGGFSSVFLIFKFKPSLYLLCASDFLVAVDTTLYLLAWWLGPGIFLVIQVQLQPQSCLCLGLRRRPFSWSCLSPRSRRPAVWTQDGLLPVSRSSVRYLQLQGCFSCPVVPQGSMPFPEQFKVCISKGEKVQAGLFWLSHTCACSPPWGLHC